MLTRSQRRRAAEYLKAQNVSERRACRIIGFSRSSELVKPKGGGDDGLRRQLQKPAEQYPRYGYSTLHAMLRGDDYVKNPNRTYRICHEEGL